MERHLIWQSQRSSSLSACSSITRESWNGRRTVWCLSRLMCSSRCSSDFWNVSFGIRFPHDFEESQGITVFGYICGALLAMIIVRMIIMKTVRVFDKPFLKTAVALSRRRAGLLRGYRLRSDRFRIESSGSPENRSGGNHQSGAQPDDRFG